MWFSISLRYRNVMLSRLTKVDKPHFMLLVGKCFLCDPYKVLTLYHTVMHYNQSVWSINNTFPYILYFAVCHLWVYPLLMYISIYCIYLRYATSLKFLVIVSFVKKYTWALVWLARPTHPLPFYTLRFICEGEGSSNSCLISVVISLN